MDGAKLDFADESFDTVSMSHGMHHLTDISAVLSEMMRVLKPGGTFVLRELYRNGLSEKQVTDMMGHDLNAKIDRLFGKPHYPTLTRQKIIDYVESLGFSRFETFLYLCEDCPRSKGETIDEEIAEIDEQLAEAKELPQYDELKAERDILVNRLRTVGVACPESLDVVGVK
jgi:SAM-dependent methyltransferase